MAASYRLAFPFSQAEVHSRQQDRRRQRVDVRALTLVRKMERREKS